MKRRRITLLGIMKITYTHTAVYINILTFLFVTATFYHTSANDWFSNHGILMNFILFIVFIIILIVSFSFLFVYKYDVPSSLGWYFDQLCDYSTTYKRDISELNKKIDSLIEKIELLENP